jgi:hypothetical protein
MKRLAAVLMLALLAGACDSGPKGPGDLTGTVQTSGPVLGGVVFQVVGSGIEKFTGTGGTKAFWAQQPDPKVFRVILVKEGGGELTFTASVQDRSEGLPRATVVSVVDLENRPLPVTNDFKVKFNR